ncbi:MAG: DNA-binding protein [Planctomycetes bacterium]|nr:DNA-binding protein [Planctomycetota bacterium]
MDGAEESSTVVCDSGPLIHLDELGKADLINDFRRVYLPESVLREVKRIRPAALSVVKFESVDRSEIDLRPVDSLRVLYSLHEGEVEAIAIAMGGKAGILLCDDMAARLAATSVSIEVHGTIGVLIRAIRRNLLTKNEVVQLLKSIPSRTTLHVRRALLESVIRDVEK